MPPGGLLLGDLVKQQDFRGSGKFLCMKLWLFEYLLECSGSGGYNVNPGSVSDYINTALAGHRFYLIKTFTNLMFFVHNIFAFQPLQLVAQPLRHRFSWADLKVWIIWAPFWWGASHPEHPRPFLRKTEPWKGFGKTSLEGLKIMISTPRSTCERYSSHSACWVMLSPLICLIFPVL